MFDAMNFVGAHELVVDAADHARTWADFTPGEMARLLGVYRDRLRDLRRDTRFRFALVLMNHGAAWSRYSHAHSHIVATPFAPRRIEEELGGAVEYHRRKERCAFCDQLAEERHAATRIVAEQAGMGALAPFASQHPYETWIVPSHHAADFGTASDDALAALGTLVVDVLGRLRRALDDALAAWRSTAGRSIVGTTPRTTGTGRSYRSSARSSAWNGRPGSSRIPSRPRPRPMRCGAPARRTPARTPRRRPARARSRA
jgi:galactose-1-phosphate uridylyltransferase